MYQKVLTSKMQIKHIYHTHKTIDLIQKKIRIVHIKYIKYIYNTYKYIINNTYTVHICILQKIQV